MRTHLTEKEITFGAPIITLYVVSGFVAASCADGPTQSDTCDSMYGVASISRSLILLGMILTGNYTINALRVFLNMPWAPSVPTQYYLLKQYTSFRNVFILYILLPTIYVIIGLATLSWRTRYIELLLLESVDLLLLLFMVALFPPMDYSAISRAFESSTAAAIAAHAAADE